MIRKLWIPVVVLPFLALGTPPADSGSPVLTDTYIFKGGEAFSQVLVAETLTDLATPLLNPNTLADGSVDPPDANCGALHFTGLFQGADTPTNGDGTQKNCGWGKLSLIAPGPNVLQSYATAWTSTETAHRVLIGLRDLGGTSLSDAAQQIGLAVAALQLLDHQAKDLQDAGTITGDQRKSISNKIVLIKKRLAVAAAGIAKLTIDPAIDSTDGTLVYFVCGRALVLAESEMTKMLQKMEDAGLLPAAQ